MSTFVWPITVYYEDTDVGGVVYHSKYLNFFERARTEWLLAIGVAQAQLFSQDIVFVVSRAEVDFKRPAKFEQKLQVVSTLSSHSRVALNFEQKLVDEEGTVYCQGTIKVVCLNKSTFSPTKIPATILEELTCAR